MLARLNPRTKVRKGDPIELVVDTHRLHFFDPDDGSGIYGGDDTCNARDGVSEYHKGENTCGYDS